MKSIKYTHINEGMTVSPHYTRDVQEGTRQRFEALLKALTGGTSQVVVLHGCEVTHSGNHYRMTAGAVYYNGDLYSVPAFPNTEASGGQVPVFIVDEEFTANALHGDNAFRPTFFNKQMKLQMGAPDSGIANHDGVVKVKDKLEGTLTGKENALPARAIIMWSGNINAIPTGWALCDGTRGTPNLKGRFVVGYDPSESDYNQIGNNGGEKEHTLTIEEMPSHSHDMDNAGGRHQHTVSNVMSTYNSDEDGDRGSVDRSDYFSQSLFTSYTKIDHKHAIKNKGQDAAHENRPPYYVLAFIMKL